MIEAVNNAQSGMLANQKYVDLISNNIANMQTIAFKKSDINFVEMIGQVREKNETEGSSVPETEHLNGVNVASISADFSPGKIEITGNALNLAIDGEGFMRIELPDGSVGFTRAGNLSINPEGYLMTLQGQRLADNIAIPPDTNQLFIHADGRVEVSLGQDPESIEIGQIELVRFTNPAALANGGQGEYRYTEVAGEMSTGLPGENGLGHLRQGFLELSNVNMVEEMSKLMLAQRSYQLNARVITTSERLVETLLNLTQ